MMPSLLPFLAQLAEATQSFIVGKRSYIARHLVLPLLLLLLVGLETKAQCPPANAPALGDNCAQSPVFCGGLDGYCSTLPNNNVQQFFIGCTMNVLNNDVWLAFTPTTSSISLLITPSNCQGISSSLGMQGAIFGACVSQPKAIQCNCTADPFILSSTDLVPGQVYYLVLDGCAGDICDYTIDLLQGATSCQPTIIGPPNVCLGDTTSYYLSGYDTTATVEWQPISNANVSIDGSNIEIAWSAYADTTTLCALVTDTNQYSQLICLDIHMYQPMAPSISGPNTICVNENAFYTAIDTLFCGEPTSLFWSVGDSVTILSSATQINVQVNFPYYGLHEVCINRVFGTDTVKNCTLVDVTPELSSGILVGNPPMPIGADSILQLCPGDSLILGSMIIYLDGSFYIDTISEHLWLVNGIVHFGPTLETVLPPGECYNISLSIFSSCNISSSMLNVKVGAITASVEITPATTICEGEQVSLAATPLVDVPLPCEDVLNGDAWSFDELPIPDGDGTAIETVIQVDIPQADVLAPGQMKSICANMEHTWLRDLEIRLTCPSGQSAILHNHAGLVGGELYLGEPYENDEITPDPIPGIGYDYCWTPNGSQTWLEYANTHPIGGTLPSDNYKSFEPLSNFDGCPINGNWTMTVTDLWGQDNGFIFNWSLDFGINSSAPSTTTVTWQPDNSISFYSNDSIVANPSVSTTYILNVQDDNGCNYNLDYPITVLPADSPSCNGCDTLTASIIPDEIVFDCTTTTLDSTVCGTTNLPLANAIFQWTLNGDVVSTSQCVNLSSPGQYIFTVTNILYGCTASDTLVFAVDTNIPIANAGPDMLIEPCVIPTATLDGSGSSTVPGFIYLWEGPGGFMDFNQNPTVSEVGVYTLTVINEDNGCFAMDEVEVSLLVVEATFFVETTPDTCHSNSGTATLIAIGFNPSIIWSTGETTNTITGLAAGNYGVTVTYGFCEPQLSFTIDSVSCTSTTELFAGAKLQVLPNPNNGQFSVLLDVASPLSLELELVDVLGRTVSTLQPTKTFGTGQHRLDFQQTGLPSGTYYLMLKNDNGKKGVKMEVVR